jgi:inorganic pyrophosphatase/exopolyphosphatase
MQYWKASSPALVDQAIAAHDKTLGGVRVCLVDFQQTTQMHPSIKESSVVGVIDHHALQSKTLTTKAAIFINIRPWGSTCTLLAEEFARTGRTPSRPTAGIMLSAVLSDTLNLKGPTTTERDRRMAAQLAQQLGVTDVDALAAEQFKAKSAELATVPARELIEADMKEFSFADASGVPQRPVAIASIETTDTVPVLSRTAELQAEVRRVKEARSLDALLLVVVDIVKMQSSVILAGLSPLLCLLPLPLLPLPPSAAASLNSNERSPHLIADRSVISAFSSCTTRVHLPSTSSLRHAHRRT